MALIASSAASALKRRSARRATVRARWQAAAAEPPPGRINSWSGGRAALKVSSSCCGCHYRGAGRGQFSAQSEQFVLNPCECLVYGGRYGYSQDQAQRGIELVHRAVGFDPRARFGYATAIGKPGGAIVSGAGVDAAQTVSHCRFPQAVQVDCLCYPLRRKHGMLSLRWTVNGCQSYSTFVDVTRKCNITRFGATSYNAHWI